MAYDRCRRIRASTVGAVALLGLVIGVGLPASADDHGRAGDAPAAAASAAGDNGNGDDLGRRSDEPATERGGASAVSSTGQPSSSANSGCGQYCAVPQPEAGPSQNGNAGGDAVGRPCAGCVGSADDMNPNGQRPNGSDHNNGYECDGNHGIARTNPAHTGCKTPPPPPAQCVEGVDAACTPPPPGCVASATETCSEVLGETITRSRPTAVLGATAVRGAVLGQTGSLPRTGSDVVPTAMFAAGLLVLGETLRRIAKRTPVSVSD